MPFYSIIGGKLTTCRSLAEEAAGEILKRLGLTRLGDSSERAITEPESSLALQGTNKNQPSQDVLIGTQIPLDAVRNIIRDEWVTKLDDLVERRLMLLYQPNLQRKCLEQLADLLIEANLLEAARKSSEVDAVINRLSSHFGKRVIP